MARDRRRGLPPGRSGGLQLRLKLKFNVGSRDLERWGLERWGVECRVVRGERRVDAHLGGHKHGRRVRELGDQLPAVHRRLGCG